MKKIIRIAIAAALTALAAPPAQAATACENMCAGVWFSCRFLTRDYSPDFCDGFLEGCIVGCHAPVDEK